MAPSTYLFLIASAITMINEYTEVQRQKNLQAFLQKNKNNYGLPILPEKFDFIVVGGGICGCAVAAGLVTDFKVLMLESGMEPVPQSRVAFYHPSLSENENINFIHDTEPQRHLYPEGRKVQIRSAKVLGGGSSHYSIDFNLHDLHRQDYKCWSESAGDEWNYEHVMKFYAKISKAIYETRRDEAIDNDEEGHGPDGRGGRRQQQAPRTPFNAYSLYIDTLPDSARQNLVVQQNAHVERIIFGNGKARAVRAAQHPIIYRAGVTKEIILCPGPMATPSLLISSGIGPKDNIPAGVEIIKELHGVGKNLADGVSVTLEGFRVENPPWKAPSEVTNEDIEQFQQNQGGLLSTPRRVVYKKSLTSTQGGAPHSDWPDVQVQMVYADTNQLVCQVFNTRPESRGEVGMKKGGPDGETWVRYTDPNYLESVRDIAALRAGIRHCFDVIKTPSFQRMGVEFLSDPILECAISNDTAVDSDEYWDCFITKTATSAFEMSGTCRMGKSGDPMAVVDSNLNVIGVVGLRVADTSVIPCPLSTENAAASAMIAEKLVEILKKMYLGKSTAPQPSSVNQMLQNLLLSTLGKAI